MEVSADEYMNWGRTRLRVELKKRGLSPSGLKTELLARLEDYFKRQRGASGGAGHHLQHQPTTNHSHAPSFNNNRASGPAASSSSSSPAGQQHHLLPKQHHSKQLLDLFHQQHSQQQQQLLHQQHSESAALGAVPRKRPRKSQTPQRGLQPQGSADNTSSEGEGSDHSGGGSPLYGEPLTNSSSHHYLHLGNDFPSSSSSAHASKKPRLDHKHQQQQHESDDSNEGVPTKVQPTPLSGRAFKKESGQVQAPHAEVRSVETIAFGPGDHFHFTHRFWRGKLLRRRFDFYGTYSIVPATTATPSEAASASASATPVAGPLSSGEGLHLDDLVALSCAFAAEAGEKDGAAEESRLRELTEGKVILHWPSKLDAPELRDWQFDKSYSHLFLAATSAPSTSPSRTGLSSSSDSASPQPGSTSPVLGAGGSEVRISPKRPHFLYTKHSAVFVEDTC